MKKPAARERAEAAAGGGDQGYVPLQVEIHAFLLSGPAGYRRGGSGSKRRTVSPTRIRSPEFRALGSMTRSSLR